MTIAEIRASTKAMLTPADIAPILGSDPQTIRLTAIMHPERIGFSFSYVGNRMKIPREAFLRWLDGVMTG